MKRSPLSALNFRGILTILAVLAAVDLTVAFAAAPWVTRVAQEQINRFSKTKIRVGQVRLHPLLLSAGVSDVEVHDAATQTRQFRAANASVRIDIPAALAGRAAVSELVLEGVELEAVRDASGGYRVTEPSAAEMARGAFGFLQKEVTRERMDFFGSAYDKLKTLTELNRRRRGADRTPRTEVREVRRGRVVDFSSDADPVFEIGRLRIRDAAIVVKADGGAVPPIRKLRVELDGFQVLKKGGFGFRRLELQGRLESARPGEFALTVRQAQAAAEIDAKVRGLDLAAFGPLFADSLPVAFETGQADIDLRARLDEHALAAKGRFKISDHRLAVRKRFGLFDAAGEPVIAAINRRQPFEMPFEIGGTPDRPAFTGFQQTLFKLLGDDLKGALAGDGSALREKGKAIAEQFKNLF